MNVWCQEEDICVEFLGTIMEGFFDKVKNKHSKRMRCSACGKRFMTFLRECDDPGCYHVYFPKHKKPVKKARKVSRDDSSRIHCKV